MPYTHSQLKAVFTISKYSLLATLRSPTSIVFSLLFPIIFITVFGTINVGQSPDITVALTPICDTGNIVFKAIKAIPNVRIISKVSSAGLDEVLQKGRIIAVMQITPFRQKFGYSVNLRASASFSSTLNLLKMEISQAIAQIDQKTFPANGSVASVSIIKENGRVYRNIDFILPGQLGFSLLMAGVYGSSFLLFSLRKNLVLKRLRATPVTRWSIIAGEMLSRLFFHVISFIIMVTLGYFAFSFTLVNGATTFAEMLVFSLFGLFIFMGIGFMISGLVQNENSIAPIANTVVLPQILLCGLFFPVDNYPHFMQQICSALPLSLFVDGLRKIAFEGTHIWELPVTIGGLLAWTLVIGPLAIRSFKWE